MTRPQLNDWTAAGCARRVLTAATTRPLTPGEVESKLDVMHEGRAIPGYPCYGAAFGRPSRAGIVTAALAALVADGGARRVGEAFQLADGAT